jgi:GT2 family glycosyltransferase
MITIPVAIINYNGKKTLLQTVESILNSKGVKPEVYVYDDCSTDNALEELSRKFPQVKIYSHPFNTRNPNVLRNKAVREINSEKIFITDNDIIFDEYCLKNLNDVMDSDPLITTCSPRLMYQTDEKRTYFAGVQIHFMAAAIGKYREEIIDHSDKPIEPNSGGGIMLLKRSKALEVGAFDEDYGLAWGDDGEFYQRLLLSGYKCLYVPNAFGYHEYKPFGKERYYRAVGQVRNRLMFIATHYSKRTIILLTPAFIVYELMEFVFMLSKRIPSLFFKGEIEFFKRLKMVRQKRKKVQRLRKVSDKDVLSSGEIYISPAVKKNNKIVKTLMNGVQGFFRVYWKIISPLIP